MKKHLFIGFLCIVAATLITRTSYAQQEESTGWIYPVFAISEEFDDNVFLTQTNTSSDFVTHVYPGIVIEPTLSRHEFKLAYLAYLQYFSDFSNQNTENHNVETSGVLNFNQWRVQASNQFRYFENRVGTEDTTRVPRTSNTSDVKVIYAFNKMDVGLNYVYRLEDYRSNLSIGSFSGQSLTYQDLDSEEHSGEVELAFHLWPKTSLLTSARLGILEYDTGRKSDSDYFDVLIGARGDWSAKSTIEGKVGYRSQKYDNFGNDFSDIIVGASFEQRFSARDTVNLTIDRITNSTTYQNNAYYVDTMITLSYSRDLTQRINVALKGGYGFNKYPFATTEGSQTDTRQDDLWTAGLALGYVLPKWGEVNLDYEYLRKSSTFEIFDYENNRVSMNYIYNF